ncbi:hypothetical protein [Rhodomicrobium lacus]|uniref:hypothetical protein n=1 Tax=Rhodomicrobium lacus TaxID=2498452 RepID=UPI000F8E6D0A|nr:hypothetical protein [Rhodomicrobium lacus]
MEEKDAVVVFTARSPDRIINEGGSQAWVLNPARAKLARWLVCTQNRHNPNYEFSDATEPHGAAFLVGRISGVRRSPEEGSEDRWIIEIGEFALVSVPDVWKHWRNPVRYMSIKELSIDVKSLSFEPMPKVSEATAVPPVAAKASGALTIAEAKKGIALTFGVHPDAVEITIRG